MLRAVSKDLFACAYSWSGAGRWLERSDTRALPFVIGYHRVVTNYQSSARRTIPSMLVSTATFEKHLDWLGKRFCFVSLDDLGFHLQNERPFGRPAAAITFDDGYADVYRNAFPILKRKGIPAAVFVVTSLVGTPRFQAHDLVYALLAQRQQQGESPRAVALQLLKSRGQSCPALENPYFANDEPLAVTTFLLGRLPRNDIVSLLTDSDVEFGLEPAVRDEMAPLSWEMIQEMAANRVTIGSHTDSHVLLTAETPAVVQTEVCRSRQILELRLRSPVNHFAYPDGRCNPGVVNAVKEAGYRFGYTICRWRDPRMPLLTIPRKVLWERSCMNALGRFSSAVMNCHVNWAFERNRECEHDHGVKAA